jgi:hypothetical protein
VVEDRKDESQEPQAKVTHHELAKAADAEFAKYLGRLVRYMMLAPTVTRVVFAT